MNSSSFLATFPRQLRYWSLHCCLNALPSFLIATFFLELWKKPFGISAMLCGIVTFIILYSTITSLLEPLANENHILSRALKLGAKIRAWISVVTFLLIGGSLLFLPTALKSFTFFFALYSPDGLCGFIAIAAIERLRIFKGSLIHGSSDEIPPFLQIYTTTILEGFILSFILLIISFFAILFIQARDRKKLFKEAKAATA
jgi:hypothetical protein